MAFCGASTPIIAKYNVDTDTYSDGMVLAKLVSTNINPTYKEGSLAADDDSQAEYDKNFSYAAVDAETDTLPVEAGKIMFGYQVSTGAGEDKDEITFGGDDQANYIGYGIVVRQKVHGETSYVAIWLKKYSLPFLRRITQQPAITLHSLVIKSAAELPLLRTENGVHRKHSQLLKRQLPT